MKFKVDIQNPQNYTDLPNVFHIQRWVNATLDGQRDRGELTLRFVSKEEIQELNNQFRHKNKPTNVLSFPSSIPKEVELPCPLLGDVVICRDIVQEEAQKYNKDLQAHFAHLIIHGVLHLVGYDHIRAEDAKKMEPLEINLLASFGYKNPYETEPQ